MNKQIVIAKGGPERRFFGISALGLSFLVWVYLWFRAAWVPVAHDEAATFFYYIQHLTWLPWEAHWDANNHILNSAISSFLFPFTGSSALSIRLANLVFFPLYAYYLYRLSLKLHSPALKWMFFLALLLAHHLVGFFALSRGYGMSMALLMGSMLHLFELMQSGKRKNLVWSLVLMSLAVLANLSLLNSLLILAALVTIYSLLHSKPGSKLAGDLSITFFLGIAPALFYAFLSFQMKELGLLYYGSTESFWQITVVTVLQMITDNSGWVISIITVSLFSYLVIASLVLFFRKPALEFFTKAHWIFLIFFLGNLVIIQVLRWFFEVNYPEDRVGLYFLPMMAGAIAFISDHALKRKISWLPMLPFLFFPVHFFVQMNFDRAAVYKVDIIPEEFYDIVSSYHEDGQYPPTVGGYRVRHFCWSWHDYHRGGTESQVFWSDYPTLLTDFQIVEGKDVFWVEDQYESLAVEPINQRHLMKRKTPVRKEIVDTATFAASADSSAFRNLWDISAEDYIGKSLYLGFEMNITCRTVPFKAWIVACVQDEERKDLRYEFIALDWVRYSWMNGHSRIRNGLILHDIPPESDRILLYIWNIDEVPFQTEDGSAGLYVIH